ncbi:MAG: helix-turn-helix transcriptional regulator [Eubacteriales bacterium]|nr:helix-turn-helix transcriptional regulator [Eubacteriales bacterium]
MLPNLKRLRKEYGVSQQLLADVLGVSQQSVNQYENHSTEPDLATLAQMADYFNTSIDFLVGRTQERKPGDAAVPFQLSTEEAKMLGQYRRLQAKEQLCIRSLLQILNER